MITNHGWALIRQEAYYMAHTRMRACEFVPHPVIGLNQPLKHFARTTKGFHPRESRTLIDCANALCGNDIRTLPDRRQWRPGAWNIHPKLPRHLDGITLAMPWALISYSRSPIAARIKGLDKPFRVTPLSLHVNPSTRSAWIYISGTKNKSFLPQSLNELPVTK